MTFLGVLRHQSFSEGPAGHPLPSSGTHSTARAFPRPTASLPLGQVGRLGPRGLQRAPCPLGYGRPVRAAPLSCEKGRGPSDKVLGPPHATSTAGSSLVFQSLPSPGQAGALHGMNFTTRCLWFHYEFPDPGQGPQPPGASPVSLGPQRQAEGGSLGSPWEGLPCLQDDSSGPGRSWVLVPGSLSCPAQSLGQGPAKAWIDYLTSEKGGRHWGSSQGKGGCPLVAPFWNGKCP